MSRKFLVDENILDKAYEYGSCFEISNAQAKHMKVLRYNVGQEVIVNNYLCEIIKEKKDGYICNIKSKLAKKDKSILITLYQGFLKFDKMEFVIQKQTELGASCIMPFLSKNTVVKLSKEDVLKKAIRFKKIANEAQKQCGTDVDVKIENTENLNEINFLNEDYCILAYEKESLNLNYVIQNIKKDITKKREAKKLNGNVNIGIIVGAEGGFSNDEVEYIKKNKNVFVVGLGDNILRAETASIYLTSVIKYEFLDFNF